MQNISEHISYAEATVTGTALNNTPNLIQLANMKALADNVFEPARKLLGNVPIKINSFFRSKEVNEAAKGVSTSQHCANNGAAMDIEGIDCPNAELFHCIKDNLEFDQLIWEYGSVHNPAWVHVSYNAGKNRKQILVCTTKNGKPFYTRYTD